MRIAELFAALGIQADRSSFDRARKQLEGFHRQVEKDTRGVQRIGKAWLGGQARLAGGARALGVLRGPRAGLWVGSEVSSA